MQRDEIRLECLKLVMNRTRSPADNVTEAKVLEDYVTSAQEETIKRFEEIKKPLKAKKTIGNPDILS
ncbi:hypothetical protein E6Q11_02595 [Candidatus Dojkabacteria bacterium]|uniref:Uncharacterized protein n=1 Tax=Candidatus Dojkabacteria bacterium TaxID=2099670 RepID=A0A5C7J8P9_9BACT|nr:MAG: hypothetical protein E6Q11_02595 [Candidatus Dojkabacteria bacterium]